MSLPRIQNSFPTIRDRQPAQNRQPSQDLQFFARAGKPVLQRLRQDYAVTFERSKQPTLQDPQCPAEAERPLLQQLRQDNVATFEKGKQTIRDALLATKNGVAHAQLTTDKGTAMALGRYFYAAGLTVTVKPVPKHRFSVLNWFDGSTNDFGVGPDNPWAVKVWEPRPGDVSGWIDDQYGQHLW